MTTRHYRGFGLAIESAFDLPGALDSGAGPLFPDLVIEAGDAGLDTAETALGPYRRAGDRLEFTAPGVGRYLVEAGRQIIVEAEPGGDGEMVTALLIATALPAALWMRGAMAIHACALVPAGASGAIAITAPSGGGKSTLLAEWVGCGAQALADDVMCLEGNDGMVSGLPGGCFLDDASGTRHFHRFAPEKMLDGAPLAAMIDLRFEPGPPRLERLAGPQALELLLAARHRPKVPTLLGKNGPLLATCGLLAQSLAMYRLTIEREGPQSVIDCLAHLAPADDGETA